MSDPPSAPHICLCCQTNVMRWSVASTNGCLDFSHRAFATSGQLSAEWNRCPRSITRHASNSVAPFRRSAAGWMPARTGRLSTGIGRRYSVKIRKASLMTGLVRRVWAVGHHAGAQYYSVENGPRQGWLFAALFSSTPARDSKRLRCVTRDVSFFRSDSRCRPHVSDLSNVTPRYLRSG